jgi:hypothetical protein
VRPCRFRTKCRLPHRGVHSRTVVTSTTLQVKIFFLCDPDATVSETTGPGAGQYIELKSQLGGCEFIYEYSTALACPPPGPQPCVVQDPISGDVYDLSVLQRPTGAWEVAVPGAEAAPDRYLINLCAAVTSSECATEHGQAGCQLPGGGGTHGLGTPSSPMLSTVNGRLELALEYVLIPLPCSCYKSAGRVLMPDHKRGYIRVERESARAREIERDHTHARGCLMSLVFEFVVKVDLADPSMPSAQVRWRRSVSRDTRCRPLAVDCHQLLLR